MIFSQLNDRLSYVKVKNLLDYQEASASPSKNHEI